MIKGKNYGKKLPPLDCLPRQAGAKPAVAKRYAEEGKEQMYRKLVVLPMDEIPLRISKFHVDLKEKPLWAVYAYRTILERMCLFDCKVCRECFPTFHPAYDPSDELDLQLMRRNNHSVTTCSIEVATWQDLPPLRASNEDLLVASKHTGTCWACHVDMKKQIESADGVADSIVPKRSCLNGMNPLHGFPGGDVGSELRQLFANATVLEAMLVALEHMQVNYVTNRKTRLPKFVKNVISFPQDIGAFAKRLALLAEYREKDRVNSVRGPGTDVNRPPIVWANASPADQERFGKDEDGYMVFPARIVEVLPGGRQLKLAYEDSQCNSLGAFGIEEMDQVSPRVTMPWHPRFLKGQTKIYLRRNMRGGKKLEGLEVRWRLVGNILHALTHVARWGLDGEAGPMHRYYDRRLFHLPSVEEILEEYAPDKEVNTAEGLVSVGFDVAALDEDEEEEAVGADPADGAMTEQSGAIDKAVFDQWLTLGGLELGGVVQKWWSEMPPAAEGEEVGLRRNWADNSADLFASIRAEITAETKFPEGLIDVRALVLWFRDQIGEAFAVGGSQDEEDLFDEMLLELKPCREFVSDGLNTGGCMEAPEGGRDNEDEALEIARNIVHGWPTVDDVPTRRRMIGRFVKSFPLKFPMGIGDLYELPEDRPRHVSGPEWLQHMLRFGSGHMLEGSDGDRCMWAMVNSVLISEAAGKGFRVQIRDEALGEPSCRRRRLVQGALAPAAGVRRNVARVDL